jgi:hypothetical protein
MKLELKHLAPYLPYNLKMEHYETKIIKKLQGISTNTLGQPYCLCLNSIWYNSFVFKPILRSLSDLTKEIEVNGEIFIPLQKLEYMFGDCTKLTDTMLVNSFVQNGIVNKLIEWHFDVFNLIEKGLAININTLN